MADDIVVDLTKRLPRGAIPSPRHELAAAMPHIPDPRISVPPSFLMWPTQMSSWNNYVYGDCVSAEEAFAKATAAPQTFIPENVVVDWASYHGYLNGASLTAVMTTMQTQGFPLNLQSPRQPARRFSATDPICRSTGPTPRFCGARSTATGR